MSHSVVAWDRWYMGGASLSAGADWPARMWGSQAASGLVLGDAGPPRMAFAGNIPYNAVGQDWPSFGYEKNDRWQILVPARSIRLGEVARTPSKGSGLGRSTARLTRFTFARPQIQQATYADGGTTGGFRRGAAADNFLLIFGHTRNLLFNGTYDFNAETARSASVTLSGQQPCAYRRTVGEPVSQCSRVAHPLASLSVRQGHAYNRPGLSRSHTDYESPSRCPSVLGQRLNAGSHQ
jgi:hypothetical protein